MSSPPATAIRAFYWENILALVVTHLAGLAAIAYLVFVACSGWTLGLGLLWLLSKFGMTWGLKRVPLEEIRRARLVAGRPAS